MDFLKLVKSRYSVRNFSDKKIEEDKLIQILEAGRVAPTACNMQPERILVLNKKSALEKLSQCGNFYDAPLAIVVCGDVDNVWVRYHDDKDMVEVDTTIVADHMMLCAHSLGLGTCWINAFDPFLLRKLFKIPENLEPINILVLGYSDEDIDSEEEDIKLRYPLDDIVVFNSFR